MNQKNWQKAKQVFNDALELSANERAKYLNEVCADDPLLGEQVKTLLESYESGFLEETAVHKVAEIIGDGSLTVGQQLGRYEIKEILGTGGMGEVFLAEDKELRRLVAIKVLHSEVAEDTERVSRFIQEARAASALNHPNILTIHEIGKFENTRFIVSEYVKGETLRCELKREKLDLPKSLDIAAQVAAALLAAHEAGIVHRDVKPENIMIRNDGYVKVLDFGLAKLAERKFSDDSPVVTEPGLIMGTPRYMSPEQIRHYEVDERSDIFSLGVVFYEMIAGIPPFESATVSDIVAAVLQNEPAQISHYMPGIPVQIEKILNKALQKDRAGRYQTMAEMLSDLERFRQNPAAGGIKDRQSSYLPTGWTGIQAAAFETNPQNNIQTPQDPADLAITKYQTSAAPSGFKKNWLYAAGATLVLLVLLPSWILTLRNFSEAPAPDKHFPTAQPAAAAKMMTISRATTNGKTSDAAISPDGKYIAYVLAESGKQSLWIKHLPTSKSMQIISASETRYGNLIFSADSNFIYYLKEKAEISRSEIFVVPVLGGTPKKVAEKTNNSFSLSPDNKQFVFTRFSADQEDVFLIAASADGTGEKTIAGRKGGEWLDYPAWSPDGKRVAFVTGSAESKEQGVKVNEIDLDDLREKTISTEKWAEIKQLAWTSDGSGLLMIASHQEKSPFQIWRLSYPVGEARRITNDLNNYDDLSLTADSGQLAAVQIIDTSGIWTTEINNLERSNQISSGSGGDGGLGIAWAPNGKVVYTSTSNGKSDIWIMDGDGSSQQQLTLNSGTNIEPSVSQDNRYIVFASDRSGSFNIWRMDLDGSNSTQLTNETGGRLPQCTPDGKWVIYQSHKAGKDGLVEDKEPTLWKVSIEGGTPVRITSTPSSQPAVSPDGKLIAFYTMKEISVLTINSGEQKKVLNVPNFTYHGYSDPALRHFSTRMPFYRWLSDSSGLIYVVRNKEKLELWKISLDKNAPQRLGEFKGKPIYFDLSPDGQKLASSKIGETSNVVTIGNW